MDQDLKDHCDEQWAVAKAMMERDGVLMPSVFMASEDGLYNMDIELSGGPNGLQEAMMSVFEQARSNKSFYAIVLTGPTILLPENEETTNLNFNLDFVPKGVIQVMFYPDGTIFVRTAEKKELPGGFIEYQDRSNGFERG